MDVQCLQPSRAEIDELVRKSGRAEHGVAGFGVDHLIADEEARTTPLDHEDFVIGMDVQFRPDARFVVSVGQDRHLRSKRFALYAEDGVVKALNVEAPGEFKVSSAQAMLDTLGV